MSKTTSSGRQRGSGSKLLLGVFVGLILGVLIAFGVVLYLNKTPLPFQEKSGRPEHDDTAIRGRDALPLPGKPGDTPVEKPRFEFYKILPGTQEPAPSNNAANSPAPNDQTQDQPPAPTEQFYLQVERHVVKIIQEQASLAREFYPTFLLPRGSRERPDVLAE